MENKIPFSIIAESAKGEIRDAFVNIKQKYNLPYYIMDGIISSVLAEVRSEVKVELINATNILMKEKNEELEKAKAAAKKVLKTEQERVSESGTGKQDGKPEE